MERFIHNENIRRYRRLLEEEQDEEKAKDHPEAVGRGGGEGRRCPQASKGNKTGQSNPKKKMLLLRRERRGRQLDSAICLTQPPPGCL